MSLYWSIEIKESGGRGSGGMSDQPFNPPKIYRDLDIYLGETKTSECSRSETLLVIK